MAASNSPRITGSASRRVIARTRSGSTAATVRRIRSAIPRPEFDRSGLDNRLALARGDRERPLSRAQPGDGMAARRFGRPDGTQPARAGRRARAAGGRPSARDAARDPSLRAAGHARRMAAPDPDRRQPARDWFRHLSAGQSAPPAGAGANTADATGAVVLCRGHRAWRGADAGTDLSRTVPGSQPRQKPRG